MMESSLSFTAATTTAPSTTIMSKKSNSSPPPPPPPPPEVTTEEVEESAAAATPLPVIPMSKEEQDPKKERKKKEENDEEINYDEDDEFGEEEEWCGATSPSPSLLEEEDVDSSVVTAAAAEEEDDSKTDGKTMDVNEQEKIDEADEMGEMTKTITEAKTEVLKDKQTKPPPPPPQPLETTNDNNERKNSMVDVAFTPTSSFNDSKHKHNQNNNNNNSTATSAGGGSMDLKRAYESLEAIRKANLEIELGSKLKHQNLDGCTHCLRIEAAASSSPDNVNLSQSAPPITRRRINWLRRNRANSSSTSTPPASSGPSSSLTTRNKKQPPPPPPCLICGNPICPKHSCPTFSRSKIAVCTTCSSLLSSDYVTNQLYEDAMSAATIFVDSPHHSCTFLLKNRNYIRLLDAYDRAHLILQYSIQFIPDIVISLQENQKRANKIGLGSSATNLVGGVTGVVGAATIFTPVGPPLLLASLLFGGGATAVTAGSDRVNYKSEARQLADRILVLFDVLASLKEGMERVFGEKQRRSNRNKGGGAAVSESSDDENKDDSDDYVKIDNNDNDNANHEKTNTTTGEGQVLQQTDSSISNNSTTSSSQIATSTKVHEKSLTKTRAATNVTKTIPVVGSVVSVFTIAMETREMASTVQKIKAGNPCEKAMALEGIKVELEKMPKADELLKRCEEYLASVQQVADCDDEEKDKDADDEEGCCYENYDVSGRNTIDEKSDEEEEEIGKEKGVKEGKKENDENEEVNVEKHNDENEEKVEEDEKEVKDGDE